MRSASSGGGAAGTEPFWSDRQPQLGLNLVAGGWESSPLNLFVFARRGLPVFR